MPAVAGELLVPGSVLVVQYYDYHSSMKGMGRNYYSIGIPEGILKKWNLIIIIIVIIIEVNIY